MWAAGVAVLVVAGGLASCHVHDDDPVGGGLDLAVAHRQQQHPRALAAVLLPGRRGLDQPAGHRERRLARAGCAARSPSAVSRSRRWRFSAAQVKRKSSRASGSRAVDPLGQRVHVGRRDAAGRDHRPRPLLVQRQLRGVDQLPLARDDRDPPLRIVRHRHDPGRFLDDRPGRLAAARRRRGGGGVTSAAGPVGVDVEQRVQRDGALGVRRAGLGEVDDDAGLLAPVQAHDPARPAAGRRGGWRSARGACRPSPAARSSPRPGSAR